jgi:S-methylmethionine-dependent homocysteine/selenocysteine methylase
MNELPHDILLLDGATGSELERRGVDIGLPLWSANAILHAPDTLRNVHTAYLSAGAGAITTNTFRTHERSLAKAGIGHLAADLTRRAVGIAQAARDDTNSDALVFGSVAPLEDCYSPDRAPDTDTCRDEHAQHIGNLVDAGVDLVLIETMCSAREAMAAVGAAQELAPGAWSICFCLSPNGALLDGTPIEEITPALSGAAFIGVNCVSAPSLAEHVKRLRVTFHNNMRIAAYGNIGYADKDGAWVSTDAVDPDRFAEYGMAWIDAGASVVGGCCGTTPATTLAMSDRLSKDRCNNPTQQ